MVTANAVEYVRAYKYFVRGQYPNAGGWLDQSQKFLEAMELIESEIQKIPRPAHG
jgi:hypothetical protein